MRYLNYTSLLLISLLASGCATLQGKPTESNEVTSFSAQGWGGTICKDLNHDILPINVGFPQAVQNIRLYQSWASGFVSGANYADSDVYDVSGTTTPEDTFVWLKSYCEQNPNTAIPIALHKLIGIWHSEGKTIVKPE